MYSLRRIPDIIMCQSVKWLEREADRSSQSSAKVKNVLSYTSTPQYVFTTWYLVKHSDNFLLTLLYPSNRYILSKYGFWCGNREFSFRNQSDTGRKLLTCSWWVHLTFWTPTVRAPEHVYSAVTLRVSGNFLLPVLVVGKHSGDV
jgi:hypothetical protein